MEKIYKVIWSAVGVAIIGLSVVLGSHYYFMTKIMHIDMNAQAALQQQGQALNAFVKDLSGLNDEKVNGVIAKYLPPQK